MRARARQGRPAPPRAQGEDSVDANAVVSYNLRAIRERKGWTQPDVARRLAEFTGHELPKGSVCNMERGYEHGRGRHFDAHELYLLSVVFDVPIVYFFLPPPAGLGPDRLADTGQPLVDLYATALGDNDQLVALDERLVHPGPTDRFRVWRQTRLAQPCRHDDEEVREIAESLVDLAGALETLSRRHTEEAS